MGSGEEFNWLEKVNWLWLGNAYSVDSLNVHGLIELKFLVGLDWWEEEFGKYSYGSVYRCRKQNMDNNGIVGLVGSDLMWGENGVRLKSTY